VAMIPAEAEAATRTQDAVDLRPSELELEPVETGARHDRIRHPVAERDRLGRALHALEPEPAQHREHPRIGLDRHDPHAERRHRPRQLPGAGAQLDDELRTIGNEPARRLLRPLRPSALVRVGVCAERQPSGNRRHLENLVSDARLGRDDQRIWTSLAGACSTWSVVCSRPKRSRNSDSSSRRMPWQSAPGSTSTCAESVGNSLVTSQTWRSCTSTTPGCAAIAVPISFTGSPAGAMSSRTPPESRTSRHDARSMSAATNSAATASARTQPVARITPPATAVAMNAKRSLRTCWKLPSTLSDSRFAPAICHVARTLTPMPTRATTRIAPPFAGGGETSRRIAP